MSRSILLTQSKSKMYTEKYMQRKYVETMNFRPTLKKIIYQLKNTGAVGTDGISVLLLKKDVLAPFITWIINLSIMSFKYPNSFKVGVISPVPKSGDLNVMKNWHPVLILNAMSKERVVNHQIKEHLERFNLLLGFTFWICQPPSILFTSQS